MFNIIKQYAIFLDKYPKMTNAIMTGSLFGIGDLIAQLGFPSHGINDSYKSYDFTRTLRAFSYGALIFSFIGDKWYRILNKHVVIRNMPVNHWTNTILKVSCDQIIFAPISIPFYFSVITFMEGKDGNTIRTKIKDNWWTTLLANWKIWPIFQLFNFYFVPVQHRLLAVNLIAIFWNAYLSYNNAK